jgi:ribosomal protein S18 acetylase RimI-like enzyme
MVVQPLAEAKELRTIGSIDDFNEIFVNPANDEVCEYELSLMNEIMTKYAIDGITLDRVRYVGLSSDFGPVTKKKWEQHIGRACNWPSDIYRINENDGKLEIEYGDCFGEFITFRAGIIRSFIEKIRKLVDAQPRKIEFWDYTGSWYPLYYQVGANWASKNYDAIEYPWVDTEKYKKTGYAEQLDGLMSGFYYSYVTEQEAKEANQPAYWYSVEGSGRLAYHVTQNSIPIVGSLFLKQYSENLESMTEAVNMCFHRSSGCMLFDLSYLVENDWWRYVTVKSHEELGVEQLQENDLPDLMQLWKECFPAEFSAAKEHLYNSTFLDEQYCSEASLCIRSKEKKLLGAIVCKTSNEEEEASHRCAWITALLVKPEYQNMGYGKRLYEAAQTELEEKGIHKIYVGQDYRNMFSGIPAPTEKKIAFFQKLGFIINTEDHYDLKAVITDNNKIDSFDTTSFEEYYMAQALTICDKQELYEFLQEEFPGRWAISVEEYLENGGNPLEIIVIKDKRDSKIKGFCKVQVNNDKSGGLGPIGIAKSTRGKRLGEYLLQQSLLHLREIGGKDIGIDWTILKDYYGKFDFHPVRVYRGAYKEI